jgi:hypothetical protein
MKPEVGPVVQEMAGYLLDVIILVRDGERAAVVRHLQKNAAEALVAIRVESVALGCRSFVKAVAEEIEQGEHAPWCLDALTKAPAPPSSEEQPK